MPRLEGWAAKQTLSETEQTHLEFLLKAVRERRVEARLNRCIGDYIKGCTLVKTAGLLSGATQRHQFALSIDPVVEAQAGLHKRIALELVFLSPALQQIEPQGGLHPRAHV